MFKFFSRKKPKATALHLAAAEGNTVLVEKLISQGAEVNARDERRATPMDHAMFHVLRAHQDGSSSQPHREVIDILEKHGGKCGYDINHNL